MSTTVKVLHLHKDEVWKILWSRDGNVLVSASRDGMMVIWSVPSDRKGDWKPRTIIDACSDATNCIALSPDNTLLLSSADSSIQVWDVKTGQWLKSLKGGHSDRISALVWVDDGTRFYSAGIDQRVVQWTAEGIWKGAHKTNTLRILDMAISSSQLTTSVLVGQSVLEANGESEPIPYFSEGPENGRGKLLSLTSPLTGGQPAVEIRVENEMNGIELSKDARYALVNHASDSVNLYGLERGKHVAKYLLPKKGHRIVCSGLGGHDDSLIICGGDDSIVYLFHRDTGVMLQALSGHGKGRVNCVAWCPSNRGMFASCSDDGTIHIWKTPPQPWTVGSFRSTTKAQ